MKKEKDPDSQPYMTAKVCANICCFASSEPIRRAVYRGELPGIRLQKNRLLIPTKEFWKWFKRNTVIPKTVKEVKAPQLEIIAKPEDEAA